MTNNDILKKLRVALRLRNDEIQAIMGLSGLEITLSELDAFFRAEEHRNYRPCGDQALRYFLDGLIIHLRGDKKEGAEGAESTRPVSEGKEAAAGPEKPAHALTNVSTNAQKPLSRDTSTYRQKDAQRVEGTRRDENPSRNHERPARDEARPARNPERPARPDARPARGDERPARPDTRPARADARPARRDARPSPRDERPARRDERPAQRDERPARRDERPPRLTERAPADERFSSATESRREVRREFVPEPPRFPRKPRTPDASNDPETGAEE